MKSWELVDYFDAAEEMDEFPRTEIHSEEELRGALFLLYDLCDNGCSNNRRSGYLDFSEIFFVRRI